MNLPFIFFNKSIYYIPLSVLTNYLQHIPQLIMTNTNMFLVTALYKSLKVLITFFKIVHDIVRCLSVLRISFLKNRLSLPSHSLTSSVVPIFFFIIDFL